MMILPQDFTSERYSELYLVSDYTKGGGDPYSEEYAQEIDLLKERLEKACDSRLDVFNTNEIEPKRQELRDGRDELDRAIKKTNGELYNAKKKISASQKQFEQLVLPSGNKTAIAQTKAQLDIALEQYYDNAEKAEAKFAEGKQKLLDAQNELE